MDDADVDQGTADVAVARVLQAAEAARGAISVAHETAAALAEAARRDARAVAERARARIARGHEVAERRVRAGLDAIAAQAAALPGHDEPDAAARAHLERAVRALAAELSGGAADADGSADDHVAEGPDAGAPADRPDRWSRSDGIGGGDRTDRTDRTAGPPATRASESR